MGRARKRSASVWPPEGSSKAAEFLEPEIALTMGALPDGSLIPKAFEQQLLVDEVVNLYRVFASQYDSMEKMYEALPDNVKKLTEWKAAAIVKDTYGPLLEPINLLVRTLGLGMGDEIVSVAIRDTNGEIRVVPVG